MMFHCICLAKLKQLNRKDRQESSLRGLCGLGGSKFTVRTFFHTRFADRYTVTIHFSSINLES